MARLIRLSEDGDLGTAGTEVWVEDNHPDQGDGPRLVTLEEDGDLGPAGTQVWVDGDLKPRAKRASKSDK